MKSSKEIIEVLNDLIKINNDRIEGYDKAIENARSQGRKTVMDRDIP